MKLPSGQKIRWCLLLVLLTIITAISIFLLRPYENEHKTTVEPIGFSGTYRLGEGSPPRPLTDSTYIDACENEMVTFSGNFSRTLKKDTQLLFFAEYLEVHIFLDNKEIYRWGTEENHPSFLRSVGAAWGHCILPTAISPKDKVTITLESKYANNYNSAYHHFLASLQTGDSGALARTVLTKNWPYLLTGLLLFMVVCLTVFLFIFGYEYRHGPKSEMRTLIPVSILFAVFWVIEVFNYQFEWFPRDGALTIGLTMFITVQFKVEDACEYLSMNQADIALLDIEMGKHSGIELAKRCKELCPQINIIFVTGYSQYTMDALRLHASGYLMKPPRGDDLRRELDNLLYPISPVPTHRVWIQTFGNFEIFVDGQLLRFPLTKCRECLAYLVDRKGALVTVSELAGVLWEERPLDRSLRNYIHQVVFSLTKALKKVGAQYILIKHSREFAIDTAKVDCDCYRALSGDVSQLNLFAGEYMTNYSWAEFTLAELVQTRNKE